ncbi:prepilin-type N-terminal cleavage/methylation domain-containing protein [Bacterioplanoides sp.]|uniref:prepilin-type N-terminal cleavage/methylation domain-containing protein n=1 Tax=Bacterioplanoides sp. TaxID=2066072 RepID=UPI003B00EA29
MASPIKRKNIGFTLVELIVVIVIISIAAIALLPRFLDLRAEAQNQALQDVQGQIHSLVAIVHSNLLLAGLNGRNPNRTDPVTGGGYFGNEPANNPYRNSCASDCYFIYGTPSASDTTIPSLMSGIGQDQEIVFAGYHNNDWVAEGVTGTNIVGTFSFRDNVILGARPGQNRLRSNNCFIWYSGARADRSYKTGIVPCE